MRQETTTETFEQEAVNQRRGNPARAIMTSVMFSSSSDEWETPQDFFDRLNRTYQFTLDVCATPSNAKCARYFTKAEDGLSQPWEGTCWMNPPYGREIGLWIKKTYESGLEAGTVVVCLLPARTDTRWWHEYVIPHAKNIEFIRGRLKFSGKAPAPFPSALVVFGQANSHVATDVT